MTVKRDALLWGIALFLTNKIFFILLLYRLVKYVKLCIERWCKDMDRLITTKELAEYFNVTEMTVYRWRKQGMPFKKLGYNMYRYSFADVNEWLDQKQSVAK